MTTSGEKQYLLCGQFQPRQQEGKGEWISFTTIKTSDYEQLPGGNYCQDAAVVWEELKDLSADLLSCYNSLK
jgi:hypothetical protein